MICQGGGEADEQEIDAAVDVVAFPAVTAAETTLAAAEAAAEAACPQR